MPIVLVVDDSPVDQQLVGELLKRDFDWIVEYAESGESALQKISEIFPDIVVTDLQMPKMDGIELCRRTCQEFPHVPVVLVTGQGSEQLAVEALHAGAASYVPKSALAESLNDTVDQILELSEKNRSQDRLMTFSTNCRHQFKIENDPRLILPLIDFLKDRMANLSLGDATLVRHASVALEEAINNAIYLGNLELNENQARKARHAYLEGENYELAITRQNEEPFASRYVYVAIDLSKSKGQFIVRDQGNGFDVDSLPKDSDTDHLSEIGKRGVTLIRNFMDEVSFHEHGREIRMEIDFKN